MYDISLASGKLSNPKYMGFAVDGVTSDPAYGANFQNKGLLGIAKHPSTGKMYSHQQAYLNGKVANLYELETDGTATLIGPLRSPSNVPPDNSWDTGTTYGGNAFGPGGNVLYSSHAWNGYAGQNAMFSSISLTTGAATPYPDNVDGSGPQTGGIGHVTSDVYAMDYRQKDGIMYAFGDKRTNPISDPDHQSRWYLGEMNLTTGRWENWRPAITTVANFLIDMKFDSENRIVGVTANRNPRVAYINDLNTGAVTIGATVTGLKPGDTALTGIAKLG